MIPDFQTIMLPLLSLAENRKEHQIRRAVETLADEFKLTEEERKKLLPSGKQRLFDNRVGWAKTYLMKAHLFESTRVGPTGHFQITDRGLSVLGNPPERITIGFLEQFQEFQEFRRVQEEDDIGVKGKQVLDLMTPEELLELGYSSMQKDLSDELIELIKKCSPGFFEQLVVDLLVKMGYGGSRQDAGEAIGKSHDGGLDGKIKEDKLGLDVIYIQAKRWENSVGSPELQKFVGALEAEKGGKGIFITTSHFTQEAVNFVSKVDKKIVLIDGQELTNLMIEYNVGVTETASYGIKKLMPDYFPEE